MLGFCYSKQLLNQPCHAEDPKYLRSEMEQSLCIKLQLPEPKVAPPGDTQYVSHYSKVDNLLGKIPTLAKRIGKQVNSECLPGCTWVWMAWSERLDGGYPCSTSGGSQKTRCLITLQITNENTILKQLGQQGWPSLSDAVLL